MTTPEQPETPTLETVVALSLLRLGGDTKAARLLKEAFPAGLRGLSAPLLFHTLSVALEMPSAEHASRMATAVGRARRALQEATTSRLTVLSIADPAYPSLLQHIPDPPIVLWGRGEPELLDRPAVAIVGSRRASATGIAMATQLAREVSRAGLGVVSGLARGIDAAAHRGALEAGGHTVAVLGNGADVTYPPEHGDLSASVAAHGMLVTEFPPGTLPYASHFPLRNRIISGLSRAVVVVEASDKSGALITARAALEQGRDVLAVPGPVASGCYRGCHALIKDGARLVESVEDILDEIRWRRPQATSPVVDDKVMAVSELADIIRPGEVLTLDDLAARSGQSAQRLLADLGRLELAGRVVRMAGGTFTRLD